MGLHGLPLLKLRDTPSTAAERMLYSVIAGHCVLWSVADAARTQRTEVQLPILRSARIINAAIAACSKWQVCRLLSTAKAQTSHT
jgi:hypothetical protein